MLSMLQYYRGIRMKVLLIEDSPDIVEIVTMTLQFRWSEANLISTVLGKKGVELVKKESPDIVILDLGLPDTNGFEVLSQIRSFSDVPVVILTVRGDEVDKIRGLELGADDYMTKPFSPGELLARLKALLRRGHITETITKVADKQSVRDILKMDFESHTASVGDKVLKLGPREYDLLYRLVTSKGMVLSNQTLLEEVFPEHGSDIRFLEVYIKKLREKLEANPENPTMIINEGGTGYKFVG